MRVINIKWDIDVWFFEDEQGYMDYLNGLPTELEIPDGIEGEDEISEYLSDVTGWCHNGYCLVD